MNQLANYAHWMLRIALAAVFIFHGADKLMNPDMAAMMGMPTIIWLMVGVVEVGAALLVLLGGFGNDLLTRVGALALLPIMLGAIFMAHWGQWSFMPTESHPMGGIEFQTVLLLISLYFVLAGNSTENIQTVHLQSTQ